MQSKDQKVFSSSVIIGRGDTMSVQQIMEKINCKNLILKTKAILKFSLAHQVIDEFYSRRMADCNLGQIRLFNKLIHKFNIGSRSLEKTLIAEDSVLLAYGQCLQDTANTFELFLVLLTFDFNSDVCSQLSFITNMSLMQSLLRLTEYSKSSQVLVRYLLTQHEFFNDINIDSYIANEELPGSILKKKKIYASLIIRVFIGSLSDLDVLSELVQLTSITVDNLPITNICAKFN